jgi:hypothetical protein
VSSTLPWPRSVWPRISLAIRSSSSRPRIVLLPECLGFPGHVVLALQLHRLGAVIAL